MILLLLPYAFIFAALMLICYSAAGYIYNNSGSPYLRFVITPPTAPKPDQTAADTGYIIVPPDSQTADTSGPEPEETETAEPESGGAAETRPAEKEFKMMPAADFPAIYYLDQWATLNIEGWKTANIPVYFGDTDKILAKGAGMLFASRFCGQNGKTVISGHVTSFFYEIEDTEIGDEVTMDTVYGRYVYTVNDVVIFDYTDSTLLLPDEGKDTLVIYTCYPRKDGLAFKEKRIALVCEMTEGVLWIGS